MSDISTVWDVTNGDWLLSGASLQAGDDLQTAVIISIFTDGLAAADDTIPDGSTDRRGWWGDQGQYTTGSRLWLLGRSKQTQQVLTAAQDYITQALQWLIDQGIVAKFDILVEWVAMSTLGAQITAYRNDGTTQAINFAWVWQGID